MKVFKRRNLPSKINYNGKEYLPDHSFTAAMILRYSSLESIKRKAKQRFIGEKVIIVSVLTRREEEACDLHGKPYESRHWVFTTRTKQNQTE